ncbi:MAG: hypothetical protein MUE95_06195 [Cyclobacteriaceae bacterium]|jgi:hypothetical protein|nr:hypothetical protein [Cyclobacteriaceae bacterium]
MASGTETISKNIDSFRRKYYLNLLLRGLLLSLTIWLSYFLLASLLEYTLWLPAWGRFSILGLFIVIVIFSVYRFLKEPLQFWIARKGLADEQVARLIGSHFPDIRDRLVNLIQLLGLHQQSELAYASIQQKSKAFEPIRFDSVLDLRENIRYARYLAIPLVIIFVITIINREFFTASTHRIVNFNQDFQPQAPFQFKVLNAAMAGFFNEDFTIELQLEGSAVPEIAYLLVDRQRLKMENNGIGQFRYTFERLQESREIQFEAAGFRSSKYQITLANRPELNQIQVLLEFPRYLQRNTQNLVNAGNIEIPEGTIVTWKIGTVNTQKVTMQFGGEETQVEPQITDNQIFSYKKGFQNPDQYEIILENEHSRNKDRIAHRIDIIKDQYPQLSVNSFRDSVLYKRIVLGGMVSDDYGISRMALQFHVKDSRQQIRQHRTISIPVNTGQPQQSFFYNWSLDSVQLNPGDYLEYYLQVWDNDGVNGSKTTRSSVYTFYVPDKDQLVTDISSTQSKTERKIEESVSRAAEVKKQLNEAQNNLKGKQSLDWQDKKKLEDMLEKRKDLERLIDELKSQNKLLDQKKEVFTEQDERIREKAEQLQKLMDELLDEETKRLMQELEKLLKENADVNQLRQQLDKLNKNSQNLEKELERTLELFKQLQFEYKMDQAIQDLQKNIEDQKNLMEKTEALEKEMQPASKNKDDKSRTQNKPDQDNKNREQQSGSENADELAEEQSKVADDFKKTNEKLEELRKLGEDLKQSEGLPEEDSGKDVEDSQQKSSQDLKNAEPGKSKDSQQKAIKKMQEMKDQLESMQGSMSMEMDMQNLESLRQILHGLIKLSHDQEGLMKGYAELQVNDPRFNHLAQQQLKLKDDVKVLEDSLLELSKRDVNMMTTISREVTELNDHLDKTIEAYRERRRQQIATEMQLSMTSINNLALMLDSHMDMMMEMMANAKPSAKKGKQKSNNPSLSQMQQQLNQKIEELKNSGKSGRQLSEELAEMAAEQERIRRALQEMEQKMKEQGGTPGSDIPGKMEETEVDLVNKRLTDQLIQRQREILTRLLETEKSMREQDLDEERKGETAKDYERELPKAIEDYLRQKEREVELLRTLPPKLYPFYRKEVNDYFNRLRDN